MTAQFGWGEVALGLGYKSDVAKPTIPMNARILKVVNFIDLLD
jgi:hypothetical protein